MTRRKTLFDEEHEFTDVAVVNKIRAARLHRNIALQMRKSSTNMREGLKRLAKAVHAMTQLMDK